MPFDWRTPIGYIIAITLIYISTAYTFIFAVFLVSLEIGSYLMAMEFLIDIKSEMNAFNKISKSTKNQSETVRKLNDSIQFHTHVRQLSSSKKIRIFNF